MRFIILILSALALVGCQNSSGVMQIAPGKYMISRTSAAGAFASMPKMKAQVIAEANAFAAQRGKVAVVVDAKEDRPRVGGFPTFDYTFILVDPKDPRANP